MPGKGRWLLLLLPLLLLPLLFTGLTVLHLGPWTSLSLPMKSKNLRGYSRHLKHTHLVLGPAAGQGLAGRVQCKGLTAITGTHIRGGSCLSTDKERASFVTVLVPHNQEAILRKDQQIADVENMKLGNQTLSRADRPYAIIKIFFDSIQVSMPGSEKVILSDPGSQFSTNRLPRDVTIHRAQGNYARNNLMLQRLESYIDFLDNILASKIKSMNSEEAVKHIIFMDSDIIVVGDLGCVFKNHTDFDIALTFRNNKGQPVNSGVIMVQGMPESILRARNFLYEVVKVYKARFRKAAGMLGDQLSLAWVVLNQSNIIADKFKRPTSFETEILKTRVLFLPSAKYNWTPSEGAGQFHGMPEDVQVIHFKGSRKRLMIDAWNFYKSSHTGFSDMKCLILKSGRTKYDF